VRDPKLAAAVKFEKAGETKVEPAVELLGAGSAAAPGSVAASHGDLKKHLAQP
jgi:hypothetical protein